jgi:hypothetical protein
MSVARVARNEIDKVRYSYDLRTLSIEDVLQGRGPATLDGKATGSTLKGFLRVSDWKPLDPALLGEGANTAKTL